MGFLANALFTSYTIIASQKSIIDSLKLKRLIKKDGNENITKKLKRRNSLAVKDINYINKIAKSLDQKIKSKIIYYVKNANRNLRTRKKQLIEEGESKLSFTIIMKLINHYS